MDLPEQQKDDLTQMLDQRDAIRFMPGMYIGGTDQRALHHVIWSLVENAAFEALANKTGHIHVQVNPNNSVSVSDDGPGLPIGTSDFAKWWLTSYKISSKYWRNSIHHWKDRWASIKISYAVAEYFTIQSKHDGFLWELRYRRGEVEHEAEQKRALEDSESSGTTLIFEPDYTIFQPIEVDHSTLAIRLRELAYLEPRFTITYEDQRGEGHYPTEVYCYPNGLKDFDRYLNRDLIPLHDPILIQETFTLQPKADQLNSVMK